MKTLLTILAFVFLLSLSAVVSYSQSETTMQDILETVNQKIVELEDEKDQEVVNITFDLLVRDGKKTVTRYLDPSFDYKVMAIGDRRIAKLYVFVYKKGEKDWEYVTEAKSSTPQFDILPTDYQQYEFTVSVEEFKGSNITGHFALLIYHRDPTKKK